MCKIISFIINSCWNIYAFTFIDKTENDDVSTLSLYNIMVEIYNIQQMKWNANGKLWGSLIVFCAQHR